MFVGDWTFSTHEYLLNTEDIYILQYYVRVKFLLNNCGIIQIGGKGRGWMFIDSDAVDYTCIYHDDKCTWVLSLLDLLYLVKFSAMM